MQSLVHGNFSGAMQRRAYAMVGAAAAIAAAVGPLLGGFITTYLSWRVALLLEDVVIAIVAAGVDSAAGSFGLTFGLAFAGAIMLATLSIAFTTRPRRAPCSRRPSNSASPTCWSTTRR
jgi:MFS family permease